MINDFIYRQPVKVFFGVGKFRALPDILKDMGISRCVIVCGGHFAPEAERMMTESQVFSAAFSGVEPNPKLSGVRETVRLARESSAQAIVGVGGGSAIDTAKFAAACALAESDVSEYYNGKAFPQKRLAVIAVPTTAGTGSEVTQVSVISDGSVKKTINDPAFMPTAAIVDPILTLSVSPRTTMNTGLDALAHALEGYWSVNHQPICDLTAVEAVRLILENLEKAYNDGTDLSARSAMAYASLLAGMSFAQPKTAGCHACSYPLSADYRLPHGEACAFTLDSFVLINNDERLERLCAAVGIGSADRLAARIRELKALGGLRAGLSELENVDIDRLSADCAAHPLMKNNPVCMDARAVRAMLSALK